MDFQALWAVILDGPQAQQVQCGCDGDVYVFLSDRSFCKVSVAQGHIAWDLTTFHEAPPIACATTRWSIPARPPESRKVKRASCSHFSSNNETLCTQTKLFTAVSCPNRFGGYFDLAQTLLACPVLPLADSEWSSLATTSITQLHCCVRR